MPILNGGQLISGRLLQVSRQEYSKISRSHSDTLGFLTIWPPSVNEGEQVALDKTMHRP
jgi:hypothetical protein